MQQSIDVTFIKYTHNKPKINEQNINVKIHATKIIHVSQTYKSLFHSIQMETLTLNQK